MVARLSGTRGSRALPHGPYVAVQLAPDAAIQAAWQAHPQTRTAPLAIARDTGSLLAASPHAAGVRPGHTRAQARLLCPDLVVVPPDTVAASLLYDDLLRLLSHFSPTMERTDPDHGLVLLDAQGCAALWGHSEAGWIGAPLAAGAIAAARDHGLHVRVGCAGTPFFSRLLCAASRPGVTLALSPAEAVAYVRRLPLSERALGLPVPVVATLEDVGIRLVSDFLGLSHTAVALRFGPAVGLLYQHLAGADARPLRRWTPPAEIVLSRLVDDCENTLVLGAIIEAMCVDLHGRLVTDGHAAGTLTLRLALASGQGCVQQRHYAPALEALVSLRQAVHALRERCSIDAAVTTMEVRASNLYAQGARQEGLWTVTADRKRERLHTVLAAYGHRTGAPIVKRWHRDPHSPDGWTRDEE